MIHPEDHCVLRVNGLTRRFGLGCAQCLASGATLNKNYCQVCGTVHALRNIRFDLWDSEILGIVGESGSGKSTLMQCLYFDQQITAGEGYLRHFGQGRENIFQASSQRQRMIRNTLFGKVYQNPLRGLKMEFSALGNIAEKLLASGQRNFSKMHNRAETLLTHVNIPVHRMLETPNHFSGGMQQRVQIAKALSNNPPILLLDEVTTGLDLSVQAKVLDLIKSLQRELGIAMILVSHDLGVIRMLADRTLVLLDGEIIEHGLTDQILEDPQQRYTQELVHSLL